MIFIIWAIVRFLIVKRERVSLLTIERILIRIEWLVGIVRYTIVVAAATVVAIGVEKIRWIIVVVRVTVAKIVWFVRSHGLHVWTIINVLIEYAVFGSPIIPFGPKFQFRAPSGLMSCFAYYIAFTFFLVLFLGLSTLLFARVQESLLK